MKKYKWDAREYEKHSQGQQKWARELIEKISLKGTENVLDLGCILKLFFFELKFARTHL